jgi:hypothetical protein
MLARDSGEHQGGIFTGTFEVEICSQTGLGHVREGTRTNGLYTKEDNGKFSSTHRFSPCR